MRKHVVSEEQLNAIAEKTIIYVYIIDVSLSAIFFRFGWCRVGVNWQSEKRFH